MVRKARAVRAPTQKLAARSRHHVACTTPSGAPLVAPAMTGWTGFHMDRTMPASTYDSCDPSRIVAVGLVRHFAWRVSMQTVGTPAAVSASCSQVFSEQAPRPAHSNAKPSVAKKLTRASGSLGTRVSHAIPPPASTMQIAISSNDTLLVNCACSIRNRSFSAILKLMSRKQNAKIIKPCLNKPYKISAPGA